MPKDQTQNPNDKIQISKDQTPFVFFGSSRLSVIVLDELARLGYAPTLIVTTPDKPQGRKLEIKPNVVKEWANKNNIPVLSPAKLDDNFFSELENLNQSSNQDKSGDLNKNKYNQLFVVASYGKIMPNKIIEYPVYKTLNIHPSLLPQYRGASSLPSAILNDTKHTGVSIMKLDMEMDHGPIVAQKIVNIENWPNYEDFEEMMAREGTRLLVKIIPDWISGEIKAIDQDHSKATYTKKLDKSEADLKLSTEEILNNTKIPYDRAYEIFRKIQAFHGWMNAYFFIEHTGKMIRVKVTDASFEKEKLSILKVIPEGKKETPYDSFVQSYLK